MRNPGFVLRTLRNAAGETLTEAAEGMGLTANTLMDAEKEVRRPSSTTVEKACTYYDITVSEFFQLAEKLEGVTLYDILIGFGNGRYRDEAR